MNSHHSESGTDGLWLPPSGVCTYVAKWMESDLGAGQIGGLGLG